MKRDVLLALLSFVLYACAGFALAVIALGVLER